MYNFKIEKKGKYKIKVFKIKVKKCISINTN